MFQTVINGYKQEPMSFKVVSISLPEEDHSALNAKLSELRMTRSEYVRSLLRRDSKRSSPSIKIASVRKTGKKRGAAK